MFAVEAARRWAGDGITVNALMPGGIRTGLQRYVTDEELDRLRRQSCRGSAAPSWKTPEQGAATSVLVATSPRLDGIGGRYFEDCNEAGLNQPGSRRRGVAAYALDARRRRAALAGLGGHAGWLNAAGRNGSTSMERGTTGRPGKDSEGPAPGPGAGLSASCLTCRSSG